MRRGLFLTPLLALVAGCAAAPATVLPVTAPPRLVVETPMQGVTGRHLVGGSVTLGPRGEVARHAHDGEEMLIVNEGSVTLHVLSADWSRQSEIVLVAGQGHAIAPGTVHWAVAGPEGARVTATWVVIDGQPLRREIPTPADEPRP